MKNQSNNQFPDSIEIKLVWGDPSEISTIYANNLLITHAGSEFFLVFGEFSPIVELELSKIPKELVIKPVAKIAITPENIDKFAKVINENIAKYHEKLEKKEESK